MKLEDWFEMYLPVAKPMETGVLNTPVSKVEKKDDFVEVEGWDGKMHDPLKNAHRIGWINDR